MNIASLADKLAGQEESPVRFEARRCFHSVDKFSQCALCHDICPVEAIQPTGPPTVDPDLCAFCRACAPACPAGAFTIASETADLLRCSLRLQQKRFEIICQHHPQPQFGPTPVAIRVRGCLAGLGAASYLQLALLSPEQVIVRTDGCADCPWGQLTDQIQQQLDRAAHLLKGWQRETIFESYRQANGQPQEQRPVYAAGSPPVSRRDLLRLQPEDETETVASRTYDQRRFRDRLRLLDALHRLGELEAELGALPMPAQGFARLSVSDACTACGTCARACPSGAMELDIDEAAGRFKLRFSMQACLACDVCVHLCPEMAIQVEQTPTIRQFLDAPTDQTLRRGWLARCERCETWFAPQAGGNQRFCSVCDFRRRNPFGSRLPPNLARAGYLNRAGQTDDDTVQEEAP